MPRGPFTQWEYGDTSVYGPLTKTVEDAALVLDQVVGPSPHDPISLPHPGLSYVEALREALPTDLVVGWSPDLGYAVVQADVAAAVEDGLRFFERRGHRIERITDRAPVSRAGVGAPVGVRAGRSHPSSAAGARIGFRTRLPRRHRDVVDLDRNKLEEAPTYATSETPNWSDRRWGQQVHDYYGTRPYWE